MSRKTIILFLIFPLLTACSIEKKIANLLDRGSTQKNAFKVEMPFEYKYGLVFIKVDLNDKTYDFIMDSGQISVLSKEVAETLVNKKSITLDIGDGQYNTQAMDFIKIDELSIGGIKFEDTACGVGEINQNNEINCFEVAGIIGANLMKLAVWEIDYKNQILTISDTKESLLFGSETTNIPFYTNATHVPYCDIKINDVVENNVILDLGSNGGFGLRNNTYEKIQKDVAKSKKTAMCGVGWGFHGYGKIDTSYYLQANEFSVGDIHLNNQIVKFSNYREATIGNMFFENYDLVFDWNNKEIILSPHTDYDNQKFSHVGYTVNYKDDVLRIASLIKGSKAEKSGMQVGDKILQVDGTDYSNCSLEDYCKLFRKILNKEYTIKNLVVNRNGEQLSIDIQNETYIK